MAKFANRLNKRVHNKKFCQEIQHKLLLVPCWSLDRQEGLVLPLESDVGSEHLLALGLMQLDWLRIAD